MGVFDRVAEVGKWQRVLAVCSAVLLLAGLVAIAQSKGKGSAARNASARVAAGDRRGSANSDPLVTTVTTAASYGTVSGKGGTQPGGSTAVTIRASTATGLIPMGKGTHGVTD